MTRARRRSTSWEPADADFTMTTVGTTAGAELLNSAQVSTWGPATMVRLRGVIYAMQNNAATAGNEPGLVELQIRKVSLEATDSVFTATTEQLDAGPNLANEDILWTGAVLLMAYSDGTKGMRGQGFVNVDVKAKRRFESAEERLVLEAMPLTGDGSGVRIVSALRALLMF